jgi:vesicle transport protein SEC22
MVKSTQITRLDGVPLAASVDDDQSEAELAEIKKHVKTISRRLSSNSEPRASIESGPFTIQYYPSISSLSPSFPPGAR